jgi:hypothetical protein
LLTSIHWVIPVIAQELDYPFNIAVFECSHGRMVREQFVWQFEAEVAIVAGVANFLQVQAAFFTAGYQRVTLVIILEQAIGLHDYRMTIKMSQRIRNDYWR